MIDNIRNPSTGRTGYKTEKILVQGGGGINSTKSIDNIGDPSAGRGGINSTRG